ncbi:MAG: nucleotidyltransferase domain-containing protein [Nanoarchaeota archaeon]|nr:nucleotidyltransferase domain-containing protein [Nanoarchaeota archaeon]
MLTPKQIRVFGAFLRRPYKELTYRQIKEFSKEKSNSVIQKAIAKFIEEDLVKKREVGNMFLYAVNVKNTQTLAYFGILIPEKLPHLAKLALRRIQQELAGVPFASIVVFGSHVEGKQTEKSDLDVAIFVNSEKDKKNCELSMNAAEIRIVIPLDTHVFLKEEMLQMLKDPDENLGKQIARKHFAIQNPLIFYAILEEGITNGFKFEYS